MLRSRRVGVAEQRANAPIFAALGDETRLMLLSRLCSGEPQSISRLTDGLRLTRQAVTKHLRVLESAGVVSSSRSGRESLFEFKPEPIEKIRTYLDMVSDQWDETLGR